MIINTVGRIILKDGILVFERFGAAVARKVKLGTSAFANIVNNATTTEEGFVPDARVVAQQQQLIEQQQAQIESLNSAIETNISALNNRAQIFKSAEGKKSTSITVPYAATYLLTIRSRLSSNSNSRIIELYLLDIWTLNASLAKISSTTSGNTSALGTTLLTSVSGGNVVITANNDNDDVRLAMNAIKLL